MLGHRLGSLGSSLWDGVESSGWLIGSAFGSKPWGKKRTEAGPGEGEGGLNDFSYPHRELWNHSFVHWPG